MLEEMAAALRWSITLSKRCLQIYPEGLVGAIILSFLAQLALIASLLLPLKIVMIMSSGNIPNIFPALLTQFGEKPLILGISALAVGAFFFNNIANNLTEKIASKGAQKLQATTNKLALFENQEAIAENAVQKVSSTWACTIFVVAGLSILSQLYPLLVYITLTFISLCLCYCAVFWERDFSLAKKIDSKPGLYSNLLGNIGFLVIFAAIVWDYMVNNIPGFLSVLLSLVLSRQILSQLATATSCIHYLKKQENEIKALAFEQYIFHPKEKKSSHSVWGFLDDLKQRQLLSSYISHHTKYPVTSNDLIWTDSGVNNILHFSFFIKNSQFIVKVFDKNKSAKAKHEAALLLSPPEGIPCPPMINAGQINGYHIHIFDLSGYKTLGQLTKKQIRKYEKSIASTSISKELIHQYQRSRPMLWDRINEKLFHRIYSTDSGHKEENLQKAIHLLPKVRHALKNSQLAIYKPVRRKVTYYQDEHQNITNLDWGEWRIEPKKWSTIETNEKDSHYEKATPEEDLVKEKIVNTCMEIEEKYQQQRYNEARILSDELFMQLPKLIT
jgi:hypothetical protein